MKKPLLDVIFASEKRKNALLLLQEGPRQMKALLTSLGTTRQALLPQMRMLEDHYLISHYEDTYELTTIGKLVVDKMAPLVSTLNVLDNDLDYWGTHNIDFIPAHLL
jgi:predicted transcriptional regulator